MSRERVALLYVVFFLIALRVFLAGHHLLAFVILFAAWAVLSAWLYWEQYR